MNVKDYQILQEELVFAKKEVDKLTSELYGLPELKLSSAYKDGLVFGLVYETGHGDLECLDCMSNQPEYLLLQAKEQCKDFRDSVLYVVGFRPEKILKKVSS